MKYLSALRNSYECLVSSSSKESRRCNNAASLGESLHAIGEPRQQRKREHGEFQFGPVSHEDGRRKRARQQSIDHASLAETKLRNDATIRIDDRRDPGIGGADQRQTLFYGPNPRLLEVLIGAGAGAEPCVVGNVQEPSGSFPRHHDSVRKDYFIADQRACLWRAGHGENSRTAACTESAANASHLHEAEALQQILEREILAERDKMDLVVDADDVRLVVDDEKAVIDATLVDRACILSRLDQSRRADEKRRAFRQQLADRGKSIGRIGKQKGNCRLRPDHEVNPLESSRAAGGLTQIDIFVEDRSRVFGTPFIRLIDIGLDDAQA